MYVGHMFSSTRGKSKVKHVFQCIIEKGRHQVPVSPRVGGCGKNEMTQQRITTQNTKQFFVHPPGPTRDTLQRCA
jgi:hypothetical protein